MAAERRVDITDLRVIHFSLDNSGRQTVTTKQIYPGPKLPERQLPKAPDSRQPAQVITTYTGQFGRGG